MLEPDIVKWDTLARREIFPYAAAAPSPLNSQPWRVALPSSFRAEIFLEPARLLPNLDPACRQAVISLGAFIENFDLASRHEGFATDVTYFPSGWPEPRLNFHAPVARLDLIQDQKLLEDPLFSQITTRRSDRRAYERCEISHNRFGTLASSFDAEPAPITFGYTTNTGLKTEIANLLMKALQIELSDPDRFRETVAWMRSPAGNSRRLATGLTCRQLGMSALSTWYIRLVMRCRNRSVSDEILKRTLVSLARKQAHSAAAFGWISTKENHRIGQIRAGRAYERVHLSAASIGLALQPMTQIIRDYEDIQENRKNLNGILGIPETHTIQMFFRLGYAFPSPSSQRLSPDDFII
jgi:hypothetical protein